MDAPCFYEAVKITHMFVQDTRKTNVSTQGKMVTHHLPNSCCRHFVQDIFRPLFENCNDCFEIRYTRPVFCYCFAS